MVICLERGADLHMAQLMPLPLTVFCFSKIQIGFTFLIPAYPGSLGKRAVKWMCVCVCVYANTVMLLWQVLKAKSSQYLTDYHLWFSSLVKPSYSRFTRAQRLTCCLCLLLSYMTAATLWIYHFTDQVHCSH